MDNGKQHSSAIVRVHSFRSSTEHSCTNTGTIMEPIQDDMRYCTYAPIFLSIICGYWYKRQRMALQAERVGHAFRNQSSYMYWYHLGVIFIQPNMKTSWDNELFCYWHSIRIILTRIPLMDRTMLRPRLKISACVVQFRRGNTLINL
jgi:hypothetical protein